MDYDRIYNLLIAKGKKRGLNKKNLTYYTESHHIIPSSMGGSNDVQNLVLLTGREHFIAHLLLSKMYKNSSMDFALWLMCNNQKEYFRVHSRFYESARIKHSKNVSQLLKGKIRTETHKANLSKSLKGRKSPTEGIKLKDETKANISNSLKGKIQSVETRNKRSDKQKGIAKPLFPACPHCGKIAYKGLAMRWHYDQCKLNVQHKVK